jgi:hypothetical protein
MAHQFGATFVPGSDDDYFMPEVVAPSPQRYDILLARVPFFFPCVFYFILHPCL